MLGHVQRGGSPAAFDRVLAWRLGRAAVDEATQGNWGSLVGLDGDRIATSPIVEVAAGSRRVPEDLWRIAEVLCE